MRISSLILLTFGLAFGNVIHAGGDVAAGKAKSATCVACHGVQTAIALIQCGQS